MSSLPGKKMVRRTELVPTSPLGSQWVKSKIGLQLVTIAESWKVYININILIILNVIMLSCCTSLDHNTVIAVQMCAIDVCLV